MARPLLPHLPPGVVPSEQSSRSADEYDAGKIYLAKWAAIVAEQAEEAAISEHPNQSREEILSNNWRRRWSETDPRPWEEETEVGAFEVLSVCNVLYKKRWIHLPNDHAVNSVLIILLFTK